MFKVGDKVKYVSATAGITSLNKDQIYTVASLRGTTGVVLEETEPGLWYYNDRFTLVEDSLVVLQRAVDAARLDGHLVTCTVERFVREEM